MKKHFNIKKISMVLFTFICMFLLTNNVKAEEKYVCRYDFSSYINVCQKNEPDCRTTDHFLFSFEYDGSYSVKIYDIDNEKNATNDAVFAQVNQFYLDEGTTLQALKTWNFTAEKKCPSQLWMRWIDNTATEDYFGDYIEGAKGLSFFVSEPNVSVHNSNGEYIEGKCTSEEAKQQYAEYPCKTIPLSAANVDNGETANSELKTCMYAYANDDDGYDDAIKLSYNDTYVYAERVDGNFENQSYSTTNIDVEQLNECPRVLYEIANEAQVTNDLYIKRPNGDNVGIYYLKFAYSVSDTATDENEFSGCDALGPTKKYVVGIMNIIRFLIPIIIIVLSIIDFVGVIISGETEKMEKAKKRFIIRLLVGVLILFIPAILELILKILGVISSGQSISDVVCRIIS